MPDPPPQPGRAPFVLLVCGLLASGLLTLLMLNTVLAQDAFVLHDLESRSTVLSARVSALEQQVADEATPQRLARRAVAIGMVPARNPAFLRSADGAVLGVPQTSSASAGGHAGTASPTRDGDNPTGGASYSAPVSPLLTPLVSPLVSPSQAPELLARPPGVPVAADSADTKPGQAKLKSGQAKPKPGQAKPKSGQAKPKSGQAKPKSGQAKPKPGQAKPKPGKATGAAVPGTAGEGKGKASTAAVGTARRAAPPSGRQ